MIDLSYLKTTTENNTELIEELLTLFLSQLPELEKNTIDAYENLDWKALREAVHKAKNSFMIVGATKESQELKEMEIMAIRKDAKSKFEPYVQNFKKNCSEIAIELKKYLENS
jgi:HPt (histidine-containing phosphotransfer) domain-containing protein